MPKLALKINLLSFTHHRNWHLQLFSPPKKKNEVVRKMPQILYNIIQTGFFKHQLKSESF